MKILKKETTRVKFKDLKIGVPFTNALDNTGYFGIKCESFRTFLANDRYNAINLENGEILEVPDEEFVIPLPNAEFVY